MEKICVSEDECWEFRGAKGSSGYGNILITNRPYTTGHSHRVAYELFLGVVPSGLLVLHRCDNRLCCNPDHLFLGTHKDNTGDCIAKGRFSRGEKRPNAVLNECDIRKIREMAAAGQSNDFIAASFGITNGHAWCIVARKIWKHVA